MKKPWTVHLGPVSAVLWVGAMAFSAVPASADVAPHDLSGVLGISWAQLLFIGATGAWAGRVNERLRTIEKAVDGKADKHHE